MLDKLKKDWGVRATFGLVLILSFVISVFIAMKAGIETLKVIKDIYVPLVMMVISFYFATKISRK